METPKSKKQNNGPCVICGSEDPKKKYRKLTVEARNKALKNNILDKTWKLNVTQFCQVHYMSYIMNDSKKNEDTDMVLDEITFDDASDGEIYEIDFINSVKTMAKLFFEREKKENKPPIYDWEIFREGLEAEDAGLIPFFNMLEKLINPNNRDLTEQTITQRKKSLSFLCYFLAGIGNKKISAMRKDVAMFLDQSGASNQAIDTLSHMQLSSSSRENRREKNAIALIHRENVAEELTKYEDNAIIVNIDDYHNIHGLRMPTTTSTSEVYHMTTILAIPIPGARAISNNDIHNPLIVDRNSLIFQIENNYMALLSQSYNDRFANKFTLSEDDLFDNLVSYCYDADIHEKREERQLKNTLLIDFINLELKSTEGYIEAIKVIESIPMFRNYLPKKALGIPADWPGQIFPRRAIVMQQHPLQKNVIPEFVKSFIPIMGPLHVSLNSRETVVLLFHGFFNSVYKYIFGSSKKLAEKPRPWRINQLLQITSDAWKKVSPYVIDKIEPTCLRDVEYLMLKTLLDDAIPLVLDIYSTIFRSGNLDNYIEACVRVWCLFARFKRRNYNKAPLLFLSDVWYWKSINHPIIDTLKMHLVTFNDYPVENYHSLIRRQTRETDNDEQLTKAARVIDHLRRDNIFRNSFVSKKRYPYCKKDLAGLTNKASCFLLELFTKVKYNVGKSKWQDVKKNSKNKETKTNNQLSCHLATLGIVVDQRHLPMAFSTKYPPIDQSIECHLQNTCMKFQLNHSDQNYQQLTKLTLLPCGHIYHKYCLQHHDYKCVYCLNYIKDQININVESIINRLTSEKDLPMKSDPEDEIDEIQSSEVDEPEELQIAFNLEAESQFNAVLQDFLRN